MADAGVRDIILSKCKNSSSQTRVPHRKVVHPPSQNRIDHSITRPTGWLAYRRKMSRRRLRSASASAWAVRISS